MEDNFFLSTCKAPGKLYVDGEKVHFPLHISSSESEWDLEPGFYKKHTAISGFRCIFVPKSRLYIFVSIWQPSSSYPTTSSGLVVNDLGSPLVFYRFSYFEYLQGVFS